MAAFTKLLPLIAIVLCQSLSGVLSTPVPGAAKRAQECESIEVRREWRDLTVEERLDYLRAVKCLQSTPATNTTPREGIVSRYDQFQAAHFDLAMQVHAVGHFLPWHRHFVTLYHNALKEDCGYKGPATFKDSPVFDDVTGFGGNGVPGTAKPVAPPPNPGMPSLPGLPGGPTAPEGCVQTGPFKDHIVNFGPGVTTKTPGCLIRGIFEDVRNNVNSTSLAVQLSQKNFEDFRNFIEIQGPPLAVGAGLHWAGHAIVGGMMMDGYAAPGDPLFYLHHGNLDRVWWKWQMMDPENRLYQISGPATIFPPRRNVTLDFQLPFATIAEPLAVREVMDSRAYPGCFTYAD
ncbi:hypothetical protein CC1G_06017 [Coprinopsis cinerea okayama7|uniref:Tyrosinase copper-binding domain-containing protein n=1 Tax=Coprinopsis cinerea (strain Okayama-7 / 130 / ATCC MYA-4618 / FGSC 9003) TaxID=240176 RepID=A8N4N9_COPC7|nr:hypothetical protein CC1G_06017 [Coprinopsis cinerea okayama7\|eukprot:XP_001829808.2 hypothetical protein CC1G_06017 [Coprinopsis cinerea okayama7\